MVKRMIYVTFQRKGLHYFPGASQDKAFNDVAYLGNVHRHLFKFKVAISVEHDDREIEFHQFLNWLEDLYNEQQLQLNFKSCEMIADDLYGHIKQKYPARDVIIDISEDGECGCIVKYSDDWE